MSSEPNRISGWMEEAPHHRLGLRLLQICLGLMIVYRVATEWRFAAYLWGPEGIGTGDMEWRFGKTAGSALNLLFESHIGVYSVLLLILICGSAYLAGVWTWTATLILLLTFPALGDRNGYILDGGDLLANLVLIYLLLVLPHNARPPGRSRIWLHNIGVSAIAIQLMLVYAVSGFWKMGGKIWMQGTALYSISQVAEFSQPWLRPIFWNPFLVTLLTYGTILFQVWFPVAMFSRLKIPWLMAGLMLHVGIAVFMGLITFSLVMIGLDLFLITDGEYRRMRMSLIEWVRRIRLRYGVLTSSRRGESARG